MPSRNKKRFDSDNDGNSSEENLFEMANYYPSNMFNFSQNVIESTNPFENIDTVRRTRSLHKNVSILDKKKILPSRHIAHYATIRGTYTSPDGDTSMDSQMDPVQQIVSEIEQNDELMEDTPDGEALRIEALREIPQGLTVKRNIRTKLSASVSRKSKHHPIGFCKRMNYKFSFWWKKFQLRQLFAFELWYKSIKTIEGQFGSGVGAYFRFLRWLFMMNLFTCIFVISFIVVPQALHTKHNINTTNTAEFRYIDIMTGQGFFTNTVLYYGFYSNDILNIAEGQYYNIPAAYFLTMILVYFFSFILLSVRMARSYRINFIKTSVGLKNVYANKILCYWDFSIANDEAASLNSKSFYNELKELLSEQYEHSSTKKFYNNCWSYGIKIFMHLFVLTLLCATGFIIWTILDNGLPNITYSMNYTVDSNYRSIIIPVIISAIMFVSPLLFSYIVKFEKYNSPRTKLYITLCRTFSMEVVIVAILWRFWLKSPSECWETPFGQEIYRLIIFDFLTSIICIPTLDYLQNVINKHVWSNLGMAEFDIARNTLGLIYNQTLLWIGLFYSPILPVMIVIKMTLLFYIKKITVMKNCKPSRKPWMAAQTQTIFLVLTFMSLMLILLTLGYTFVSVPTEKCGPFQEEKYIYMYFLKRILNLQEDNKYINTILYFTKPGFMAIMLIAMSVAVYYLRAKSKAEKLMVKQFRKFLKQQAKDKDFLLTAIKNVSEGQWIYDQKSDTLFDNCMLNGMKECDNLRIPSNARYQLSPRSPKIYPQSSQHLFNQPQPAHFKRKSLDNCAKEDVSSDTSY